MCQFLAVEYKGQVRIAKRKVAYHVSTGRISAFVSIRHHGSYQQKETDKTCKMQKTPKIDTFCKS